MFETVQVWCVMQKLELYNNFILPRRFCTGVKIGAFLYRTIRGPDGDKLQGVTVRFTVVIL